MTYSTARTRSFSPAFDFSKSTMVLSAIYSSFSRDVFLDYVSCFPFSNGFPRLAEELAQKKLLISICFASGKILTNSQSYVQIGLEIHIWQVQRREFQRLCIWKLVSIYDIEGWRTLQWCRGLSTWLTTECSWVRFPCEG